MNILFLTLGNFDSIEDNSLYPDLLREFRDNGHNVYIVTRTERRENKNTELKYECNSTILKVKTGNITKTSLLEKGISTLMIEKQYINAIKKYYKNVKFDLVIYSTPPITFEKVIKYIKQRDGATSYLLLKDIFPQNAIDLQMIKQGGILHRYFRKKEIRLYKNSDFIGCMSDANVKYILKHNDYINEDILHVCPNAIEPVFHKVKFEDKLVTREKYGIPHDKTVFLYGGSLGRPQGIEFIKKCILKNEQNSSTFILIIGSGTEYNNLKKFYSENKPRNSKLLEFIKKADYDILANSCDVGLIFLDYRFTIPNIPSRLLGYMQSGLPILAATDVNTDLGSIITEAGFGSWCESTDVDKFNQLMNKFTCSKRRKNMGIKAKEYLINNYTSKDAYKKIYSKINL